MKCLYFLLIVLLPLISIGQKKADVIYDGGVLKLNNDLSTFLAEEAKNTVTDTAYFFIIQVSVSKRANRTNDKVRFEVFGKGNSMKKVIFDFLTAHIRNWNHRKLKKSNVLIPLFITTYSTTNKQPYFDWNELFGKKVPESQAALFFSPLIIHLYCCPSEPNRDFLKNWGLQLKLVTHAVAL